MSGERLLQIDISEAMNFVVLIIFDSERSNTADGGY
jgi:hypothetical protein